MASVLLVPANQVAAVSAATVSAKTALATHLGLPFKTSPRVADSHIGQIGGPGVEMRTSCARLGDAHADTVGGRRDGTATETSGDGGRGGQRAARIAKEIDEAADRLLCARQHDGQFSGTGQERHPQ
jgi:hypothetical protein